MECSKAIEEMELKFTSTNSNPVDRATINKDQFDAIKVELELLKSGLGFYGKWIKCDRELPEIGRFVMAVRSSDEPHVVPKIVKRIHTSQGWAWNNVNSQDFYAENKAYFNHWMPLPSPPHIESK
jgi:hypothetical protein